MIIIGSATANPHMLPNGSTTVVTVTFHGNSSINGENVSVQATVSPTPPLAGSNTQSYTFNMASGLFSITLTIVNSHAPASTVWLPGLITLTATGTTGSSSTTAVVIYQ